MEQFKQFQVFINIQEGENPFIVHVKACFVLFCFDESEKETTRKNVNKTKQNKHKTKKTAREYFMTSSRKLAQFAFGHLSNNN